MKIGKRMYAVAARSMPTALPYRSIRPTKPSAVVLPRSTTGAPSPPTAFCCASKRVLEL